MLGHKVLLKQSYTSDSPSELFTSVFGGLYVFMFLPSLLDVESLRTRNSYYLFLYFQCLKQCLALVKHSVNGYWINE